MDWGTWTVGPNPGMPTLKLFFPQHSDAVASCSPTMSMAIIDTSAPAGAPKALSHGPTLVMADDHVNLSLR